ncbi:hypothetical protein CsSME_00028284 [Camellia sinensis var. sinensis]
MVVEKDHMLAFNLSKSVCLPPDMEHHDHLTEFMAIRLTTKSIVLAMQKNHVTHKRVLELHKTMRLAMADASAKSAKLKEAKLKMAELESENARLTKLVNAAEADKQKALAEKKDRYLCDLAKLERKKSAEITKLQKKMEDAATVKLSQGPNTEIFQNPLPHFIPSYMSDYANAVQQKFLKEGEEKENPEPHNAPPANTEPGLQPLLPTRVNPHSQLMPSVVEGANVTNLAQEVTSETGLPSGEAHVDLDANLDDLFA